MATSKAVLSALKMLSRAFAGVVDPERVELYRVALDDLSDEQLAAATVIVIRTHTGEFIPPPAVLRKAVAPAPVAIDVAGIVRQIEKLAAYTPGAGMQYPAVRTVREELGESVGYAYAAAGGARLFAEDATTRSIAAREFQRAMTEAVSRPATALPLIGAESCLPERGETRTLVLDVAKRLGTPPSKRLAAGGAR